MSSSISKKGGGRPISKIWEWFVKGDLVPNSKGYYSATCSFCEYHWSTAKVAKLKKHLAYECIKVDTDTKISALMMLTNNCEDSEDDSHDTSTTSTTKSNKKRKVDDRLQSHINEHYENFPTPLGKEDQINKALAKMFVCCNLPFALIEHPFFIEFVKTLRTTYNLPSRWVLTETLIIQEISRINLKVNRIINEENNMTIAFDGWTNSTGQSIYDYCLITEDRKEYLWCSKDYSNIPHHTGAFLGEEIIKIVDDIGPERLAAVVSDNAPDARVARRILCAKYPHILNIRCMAHCINLITKDLCKHSFVVDTIRKVGIVHQYFTMSHAPCQFLKDSVKILQIKGGGLKSHTKTRWSTMWDCVSSIVRLELAFARVLSEHETDIKDRVKDILYDRNFYENCRIIASILYPLKITVGCLESRTSTLADCYVHLLSLAGAIYRMSNQNIQFKYHCIIKFNERFNEFSDDLFLLAFFLHPRYHGNGINPRKFHNITLKAAQIWKDMGHNQDSCAKLLTQLRKYRKNKAPFNQNYNYKSDTPTIWWETAQNTKEEWELQALALRLFAVSPHSASCERSFSVLGWFYGQRRTKLAADRVEGMCKLHTYYITNAKRELPYYAIDTSENSMREKMINTIVEISDELEADDFEFLYDENVVDMVIDMSQSYDLDVALDIDIESRIFNMERREPENEVIVNQNRQTVVLAPEREDFDIEALIAKEMDDNEN